MKDYKQTSHQIQSASKGRLCCRFFGWVLLGLLCFCLPVYAEEQTDTETGIVSFCFVYGGITPDESDSFRLTFAKQQVSVASDSDAEAPLSIILNVSEVETWEDDILGLSGMLEVEIPASYYEVQSLEYLGNNNEIKVQGFGMSRVFSTIGEGTYSVFFPVGAEAISSLESVLGSAGLFILDDEHDENGKRILFYDEDGNPYQYVLSEDREYVTSYLNKQESHYEVVTATPSDISVPVEYYDTTQAEEESSGSATIIWLVLFGLFFVTAIVLFIPQRRKKRK